MKLRPTTTQEKSNSIRKQVTATTQAAIGVLAQNFNATIAGTAQQAIIPAPTRLPLTSTPAPTQTPVVLIPAPNRLPLTPSASPTRRQPVNATENYVSDDNSNQSQPNRYYGLLFEKFAGSSAFAGIDIEEWLPIFEINVESMSN